MSLTGDTCTQKAYSSIRSCFESMHYEHCLYSSYKSKDEKTVEDVKSDLRRIDEILPWIFASMKRCHITSVLGESYDFMADVDRSGDMVAARENLDATMGEEHAGEPESRAAEESPNLNKRSADSIDDR